MRAYSHHKVTGVGVLIADYQATDVLEWRREVASQALDLVPIVDFALIRLVQHLDHSDLGVTAGAVQWNAAARWVQNLKGLLFARSVSSSGTIGRGFLFALGSRLDRGGQFGSIASTIHHFASQT